MSVLSQLWAILAASPVETVAVLFSLCSVVLTMRENIWCFPTGLVEVCLFVFVFYNQRLYSDLLLQIIWIGMICWGWWNWLRVGKDDSGLKVTRMKKQQMLLHGAVVIFGSFLLGWLMKTYTKADLPYWDALTTVLALTAQSLLNRKKLESWMVWITVDCIWIGVYTYKKLWPTMGRTCIFLVLATMGWFQWRKSLSVQGEACS